MLLRIYCLIQTLNLILQGSREQLAIAEFASALLSIPKTLAVNAAKDSTELVAKLRSYHNAAQNAPAGDPKKALLRYGLDLMNGEVRDNVAAGVLEPTMSKVRSLKSAYEAAVSLLRIDDAIQCAPGRLYGLSFWTDADTDGALRRKTSRCGPTWSLISVNFDKVLVDLHIDDVPVVILYSRLTEYITSLDKMMNRIRKWKEAICKEKTRGVTGFGICSSVRRSFWESTFNWHFASPAIIPLPSPPDLGHYPPTIVTYLSLQITRFLVLFSRVLGAVCVRPTSCSQKPPRRLSSVNASASSSGHVWTLIFTSLPSFMQRDILPWIQRITTPAIYMPRRCFELGRLIQRCISSIFHMRCGVVDAWRLKPSVVQHWEGTGKHERRWNSAFRTQVTHLRVCSSMMFHSSLHR
jgi:hypothetical protein